MATRRSKKSAQSAATETPAETPAETPPEPQTSAEAPTAAPVEAVEAVEAVETTPAAEEERYPDADKPIRWREHKPKTKREQEQLERRMQRVYERGGLVGSETPRARYAKHLFLSLGISRSLAKVAERLADEKLMERDGYRLDPRAPKRNEQIWKQVRKLREGDADWGRWFRTAKHRCEIWSSDFGWMEAADEHDREQMDVLRRETIQRELEMRERHLETGTALMLTGAQDYLKVSAKGGVGPTAAIQAVGMGAQLERSALALGMGGGGTAGGKGGALAPATLNGLMAALAQPPEGAPSSAAGQGGADGGVTVTQVNNETTNVTNNTVNVIAQPLTVDILRQLEAVQQQRLSGWRQSRGLLPAPSTSGTADPAASGETGATRPQRTGAWYTQLPPPPPALETTKPNGSLNPPTRTAAAAGEVIEAEVREVPNE